VGNKRRIAVITGSRADYGLLRPTLEILQRKAELFLIVTGSHLSPDYGNSVREIELDGFNIHSKADLDLTGTECPAALTMGFALSKIGHDLNKLMPDIVLVIGDRYEMAAAAMAAAMCRIPIAHIGGGELTAGAIDDALRHCITKLAYWHFTATPEYTKRVISLGEPPERVYQVGAPGIDSLVDIMPQRQCFEMVDLTKVWDKIPLHNRIILFSWQPETLGDSNLAVVLWAFDKMKDVTIIATGSNADDGGQLVNQRMIEYATSREGVLFRKNFPHRIWNSLMANCDVVVGNSSAGVIEAPVLGKASVNIGIRQEGRIMPPSVSTVACDATIIGMAIESQMNALYAPTEVFGVPGTVAKKIAETLLTVKIPTMPIKRFYE